MNLLNFLLSRFTVVNSFQIQLSVFKYSEIMLLIQYNSTAGLDKLKIKLIN